MPARFKGLVTVVVAAALSVSMGTSALAAGSDGKLKQYKIPTADSNPRNITEASDGNLWFSESFNVSQTQGHNIGRITPTGDITEFPVCDFCFPGDIEQGNDGFLYFASNDGLGKISLQGAVEFVNAPFSVGGNDLDSHGDLLWITDFNRRSLWRYDTATGTFTEFPVGGDNFGPSDVAVAADGDVWFGAQSTAGPGLISELDPDTGTVSSFQVGGVPRSVDITADSKVWFTTRFTPQGVGYFDPTTNTDAFFSVDGGPEGIAAAGNSVWFTRTTGGNIAQIDANGLVTVQSKAVKGSEPFGITVASNGDPWFVMLSANKIGHLQLQ